MQAVEMAIQRLVAERGEVRAQDVRQRRAPDPGRGRAGTAGAAVVEGRPLAAVGGQLGDLQPEPGRRPPRGRRERGGARGSEILSPSARKFALCRYSPPLRWGAVPTGVPK